MKLKQIAVALGFALCGNVYASGIPVVDGAQIGTHISNQVETIAKWAEQYKQLESQIRQAQEMLDAIKGSRGMGAIPDAIKSQLENILNNPPGVEDMRKHYPVFDEEFPKANAVYDVIAKGDATVRALQDLATQRMNQVNSLMQRIDGASDPAAKQDLANRLASEQAAISTASNLMQMVLERQKVDIERAQIEADQERVKFEFSR